MNVVCVDDEKMSLDRLVNRVSMAIPGAKVLSYLSPETAIKDLVDLRFVPDVVFTDIEMIKMNGLEFATEIKKVYPRTKIVMVTGYSNYAVDSYSIHVEGYVLKPVTVEAIRDNIDFLFGHKADLRVVTFGNFEVFYKNEIVKFPRSKAKELLAYLIDRRGSSATTKECIAILYEDRYDRTIQKMFQTVVSDLKKTLKLINCLDVLRCDNRSCYSIDTKQIDCDLFRAFLGEEEYIKNYNFEYMEQYSWAEGNKNFNFLEK